MRPSWDSVWCNMAKIISTRSYDPRHQVGTVIVTDDNTQVLSVGYNGNYSGGPNEVESVEPGASGMLHAEINACMLGSLVTGLLSLLGSCVHELPRLPWVPGLLGPLVCFVS